MYFITFYDSDGTVFYRIYPAFYVERYMAYRFDSYHSITQRIY